MTNKKLFLIILLFLLGLTSFRIFWTSIHPLPIHTHSVKGVLDLRHGGLNEKRIITLDGQWEFYPNALITSSAGQAGSNTLERTYIQVPGNWKAALSNDKQSAYGYASYRLRILTDKKEQSYGMIISGIQASSNLFVNGRVLGNSGTPAGREEQYSAQDIPYSVSFTTDKSELELIIHVANYDNKSTGGIIKPLMFGTEAAINKERLFTVSMQFMVCIVLMLHGLYAVILYLISPRQKVLLYFSLMVICATISILSDDDKLLLVWLPMSLEISVKLILLAYMGTFIFMLQLAQHLLFQKETFHSVRNLSILCGILSFLIIVVPTDIFLFQTLRILYILILFSLSVDVFLLILRSFKNKEDGAVFLLLAATSIISSGLWGIFKNISPLGNTFYPFDLIIAFLGFATFWFKRYFWNAKQTTELTESLQRAIKQKDDFLANTSHELRNPLHGIINIAETILDSEKNSLKEKNVSNLELLISVGRRMSLLLNDLLDLSQLRESNIQLQLGNVRIQSLASGVLDMLKFMTDGKPIRLSMDIQDSFPSVIGDEKRIIQILFNLLQNAVKYTREGTVTIHADVQQQTARIHIMDTGIGMDEETQHRIFKPYEQGDSSLTAMGGGIGLGLSICKQLVELHGGTLSVSSTLGEGSIFTFTLSVSDSSFATVEEGHAFEDPSTAIIHNMLITSSAQTATTVTRNTATVRRPKILAVDDDPVNLKILSGILTTDEYEITTVTSGREAIMKLDAEQWDLLISDVMMPLMSGYELTRLVRERFSMAELPILLLTARSQPEDIYAGFLSGTNDYVSKPVNALELKIRVRSLTDLKQAVKDQLRVEAAYLQAQIQPHFLFNTLNSISALASIDTERMSDMIDAFSAYLRLSFDFLNAEPMIPIERELELVRAYLYIEKERFDGRLEITWDLEDNIHFQLPPLTIQPLVENAVRHGILNRAKGGTVHIAVKLSGEDAEVSITDNGKGMNEEKVAMLLSQSNTDRGIGMLNTHKRLMQVYGKGLHIQSKIEHGTVVSFVIPAESHKHKQRRLN
ncbi:ATP-binding protein [Paenibacillus monticola]|uniref:Circadian input-output histidine kinase CikA n=1 Tax=Paenibacillus monticola TaxID=2666075 RepID=A0A7X2KZP8_9BACL|nr:ATP-binding protein [Paenibacillus monticola]MRN51937.1 response regulator [Paenibacillus monticola]